MSVITEGYIKSISIDGNGIAIKIDPTEPYIFKEEKERLILLKNETTLQSVKVDKEFICFTDVLKTGFDVNSLVTLKVNKAKVRFTCDEEDVKAENESENAENGAEENKNLKKEVAITRIEIL
jgi:hypothetical protein